MLTTDRRAQILEILRQNGSVTVSKLAEEFETSESTIRRDLLALSQLGKINKVHGGATVLGQEFLHNEEDFDKIADEYKRKGSNSKICRIADK